MDTSRWGEVSLFSMDLTVFQNFLASEPQVENSSLKWLILAFLIDWVVLFLHCLKASQSTGDWEDLALARFFFDKSEQPSHGRTRGFSNSWPGIFKWSMFINDTTKCILEIKLGVINSGKWIDLIPIHCCSVMKKGIHVKLGHKRVLGHNHWRALDQGAKTDACDGAMITQILTEDSRLIIRWRVSKDDVNLCGRWGRFQVEPGGLWNNLIEV